MKVHRLLHYSLTIIHSSLLFLLVVRFAAAPVATVPRMAMSAFVCVLDRAGGVMYIFGTLLALVLAPRRFTLCFVGQIVV